MPRISLLEGHMGKTLMAVGIEAVGATHSFVVGLSDACDILVMRRCETSINYHEMSLAEVASRVHAVFSAGMRCVDPNDTMTAFFKRGGRLCTGITGITTSNDRSKGMPTVWQRLGFPETQCSSTGDAEVLLSGYTGCMQGAVIVWHAGSVAFARNGATRAIRVGGWGPVMGDEGSGYYMGRKALHALTWHRDGYRAPCNELVSRVYERLGASQTEWGQIWREVLDGDYGVPTDGECWMERLIRYCYEIGRARIARYAIADLVGAVVCAADDERKAGRSDGVATCIIERAIEHIVDRLDLAISKANLLGNEFRVVVAGGVPLHHPGLREQLVRRVLKHHPSARVMASPLTTTYHTGIGAALHALAGNTEVLPGPDVSSSAIDQAWRQMGEEDL